MKVKYSAVLVEIQALSEVTQKQFRFLHSDISLASLLDTSALHPLSRAQRSRREAKMKAKGPFGGFTVWRSLEFLTPEILILTTEVNSGVKIARLGSQKFITT